MANQNNTLINKLRVQYSYTGDDGQLVTGEKNIVDLTPEEKEKISSITFLPVYNQSGDLYMGAKIFDSKYLSGFPLLTEVKVPSNFSHIDDVSIHNAGCPNVTRFYYMGVDEAQNQGRTGVTIGKNKSAHTTLFSEAATQQDGSIIFQVQPSTVKATSNRTRPNFVKTSDIEAFMSVIDSRLQTLITNNVNINANIGNLPHSDKIRRVVSRCLTGVATKEQLDELQESLVKTIDSSRNATVDLGKELTGKLNEFFKNNDQKFGNQNEQLKDLMSSLREIRESQKSEGEKLDQAKKVLDESVIDLIRTNKSLVGQVFTKLGVLGSDTSTLGEDLKADIRGVSQCADLIFEYLGQLQGDIKSIPGFDDEVKRFFVDSYKAYADELMNQVRTNNGEFFGKIADAINSLPNIETIQRIATEKTKEAKTAIGHAANSINANIDAKFEGFDQKLVDMMIDRFGDISKLTESDLDQVALIMSSIISSQGFQDEVNKAIDGNARISEMSSAMTLIQDSINKMATFDDILGIMEETGIRNALTDEGARNIASTYAGQMYDQIAKVITDLRNDPRISATFDKINSQEGMLGSIKIGLQGVRQSIAVHDSKLDDISRDVNVNINNVEYLYGLIKDGFDENTQQFQGLNNRVDGLEDQVKRAVAEEIQKQLSQFVEDAEVDENAVKMVINNFIASEQFKTVINNIVNTNAIDPSQIELAVNQGISAQIQGLASKEDVNVLKDEVSGLKTSIEELKGLISQQISQAIPKQAKANSSAENLINVYINGNNPESLLGLTPNQNQTQGINIGVVGANPVNPTNPTNPVYTVNPTYTVTPSYTINPVNPNIVVTPNNAINYQTIVDICTQVVNQLGTAGIRVQNIAETSEVAKLRQELDELKEQQRKDREEFVNAINGLNDTLKQLIDQKQEQAKPVEEPAPETPDSNLETVPATPVTPETPVVDDVPVVDDTPVVPFPRKTRVLNFVKQSSESLNKLEEPYQSRLKRLGKFIIRHPLRAAAIGAAIGLGAGAIVGGGIAIATMGSLGALNMLSANLATIGISAGIGAGTVLAGGSIGAIVSAISKKARKERLYKKFQKQAKKCEHYKERIQEIEEEMQRLSEHQESLKDRSQGKVKAKGYYKRARHSDAKKLRKLRSKLSKANKKQRTKVDKALETKERLNDLEDRTNKTLAMGGYLQKRKDIAEKYSRKHNQELTDEERDDLNLDYTDDMQDLEYESEGITSLSDDYKTFDYEAEQLINDVKDNNQSSLMKDLKNNIARRNTKDSSTQGQVADYDMDELKEYMDYVGKKGSDQEKMNFIAEMIKRQDQLAQIENDGAVYQQEVENIELSPELKQFMSEKLKETAQKRQANSQDTPVVSEEPTDLEK